MGLSERCFHAWQESQADGVGDAPDFILLWDRMSTARKPYRCDRCAGLIEVGEKYRTHGMRIDGKFIHERTHPGSHLYPSGCPSIGQADRAELEEQFAADQERYFPGEEARDEPSA